MAGNRGQGGPIESRLISLFASLFFSIPTAAFVWFWVNLELAVYWDGFLSSSYLVTSIIVFAVLALLLPQFFPSILGGVWHAVAKVWRWWGW
ncbi:hypothetical protein [Marinobacter xiaoshiensis]|uniref:Uncharacterized protein n=1 Tax=Marinobacter xiaoshiensis TaxID=3073652 RepID=A0ABU2HJ45_9GAMM|nr:hypothetical protein [Marinobacter sp. F60267]MDS1310783.1 hypothetical protein [Marinobacter sp. F60267]